MKQLFYISLFFFFTPSCEVNSDNKSSDQSNIQDLSTDEFQHVDNYDNYMIRVEEEFQNEKAQTHYLDGIDLISENNKSDAILSFEKALKLEPNNLTILEAIANVHGESRNYDQAIQFYNRIIEITPDRFSTRLNLGLTYFFKKDYMNAAEQFDVVIDKSMDRDEVGIAYFHKCEISIAENNCEIAIVNLNMADSLITTSHLKRSITGLRVNLKRNCPTE